MHPIRSAQYRAGSIAPRPKRMEADMMLAMHAIMPAQTEWAASIVFATKTMDHYSSASITVNYTM